MKECENCIYSDRDTDEEPCSKCLDSYIYRPKFQEKPKENKSEDVDSLSSVSTEKTGRWIFVQCDDFNPNRGNWCCSKCGFIARLHVRKNPRGIPLYKYCIHCNAKMEVEE